MLATHIIRTGSSGSRSASLAVEELKSQLFGGLEDHYFFFASSSYDLEELGGALAEEFGGNVLACTSSGEITPRGYGKNGITGFRLPAAYGSIRSFLIQDLDRPISDKVREIGEQVRQELETRRRDRPGAKAFCLVLVDGLSMREELLMGQLGGALPEIPIVGGSAGDDLAFERTFVYRDGRFLSNAALVCAVVTEQPFHPFKDQHFQPTATKMVITRARQEERLVLEINGRPAAQEYARLIGMEEEKLESQAFSKHPVMLKLGGEYYVRSIQKANPDGSLSFFCAIDEGLVLTVAEGRDFVESLEGTFRHIREVVKEPQLILGFECILRRLEVEKDGIGEEVDRVMTQHRVLGFHTYGEQFGSVHINQTFTGIALE